MSEPIIEVRDLVRKFGDRTVLNGISFTVEKGDTMIIMGGSGLRQEHPPAPHHRLDDADQRLDQDFRPGDDRHVAPGTAKAAPALRHEFSIGALLQSLTVGENVALPLIENSKVDPEIVDLVVKMKLELVGLTGFEHLKPAEISGGMRKRVGLARAVALDPELLFSDEPTSGLDPIMTAVIDQLTLDLTRKLDMTAVVVSHDMTSAFRIGTKMIMLGAGKKQGHIIAMGTPDEIRNSDNPEVQQFINGRPDGPIPLKLAKEDYIDRLIGHPRENEL